MTPASADPHWLALWLQKSNPARYSTANNMIWDIPKLDAKYPNKLLRSTRTVKMKSIFIW